MKILLIILTGLGIQAAGPGYVAKDNNFTRSEIRFIKNVIRVCGKEPAEVYRLENGKIAVNYADQRLTLGQDGFIHGLEIYEGGEWIDLGPEY
jgi:hypothetical protein